MPDITLFAWVGEDEMGSGTVGLKQGIVPAGMIPLVATERHKIDTPQLRAAMRQQARIFGKRISLCEFTYRQELGSTDD